MATRAYRQVARAAAVEDTERQITDALSNLLEQRWFDEITLDDIAGAAGTTRQTIVRRFGSKTGVLSAMAAQLDSGIRAQRWSTRPKAVQEIVTVLHQDYERTGDQLVRTLNQEARIPEFAAVLDRGRQGHREWIEDMFAPWLSELDPKERMDLMSQLLAVTDVWVWHLLRRAQKHTAKETLKLMIGIVERLLSRNS